MLVTSLVSAFTALYWRGLGQMVAEPVSDSRLCLHSTYGNFQKTEHRKELPLDAKAQTCS